jgi:opacity protein-like surface antigen
MRNTVKIQPSCYLIIGAAFCLMAAGSALALETADRLTGHVVYSNLMIQNDDSDLNGGDYEIGMFGADAQKAFGGKAVKYGVETGAMFSSDSEVRKFRASSGPRGGSVAVSMDISSVLIDYYFGAFASFEPGDRLRIYAGAGPLIIWGLWETKPEASIGKEVASESESGLGAGLYARAGMDLFFTENLGLGAGVRILDSTLRFEDSAGKVDVAGWQYYIGLAFRF